MAYHVIEIVGNGANRRYVVKRVISEGKFGPVTMWPVLPPFLTEEAARDAARDSGIEISKVGTHYQVI